MSKSPQLEQLLAVLNEQQLAVANLTHGHYAVSGVAGSGKTATIIGLMGNLAAAGVPQSAILAMTFTKPAAEEMTRRLQWLGLLEARVGTIHSVAHEICREAGVLDETGVDESGRLPTELDRAVTDLQKQRQYSKDREAGGLGKAFIAKCKAAGAIHVHGDPFGSNDALDGTIWQAASDYSNQMGGAISDTQLVELYLEYERRRSNVGLIDFDDMLAFAWLAMIRIPRVREQFVTRWRCVIVDEVQDSSPIQWDLARFLSGGNSGLLSDADNTRLWPWKLGVPETWRQSIQVENDSNTQRLFVNIGSPSQAIYAFRYAAPSLFIDFAKEPGVSMLQLPINYRSLPGICAAGNAVGRGQVWNLEGDMVPAWPGEVKDSLPTIRAFVRPEDEATACLDWAQEHGAVPEEQGGGLHNCAVLSRTALGLSAIEIECIRRQIPYYKLASSSFFDSREVREMLSYLKVACGLDADGRLMRKIVNVPFRFIGKDLLDRAERRASERCESLLDALRRMELKPQQYRAIKDLQSVIQEMNRLAAEAENYVAQKAAPVEGVATTPEEITTKLVGPALMLSVIINRTAYMDELKKREGWTVDGARTAMFNEFQRICEMFQSPLQLITYIEQVAAAVEQARKAGLQRGARTLNALVLSTVHRYKGLESPHIWIAGVNSGHMPHERANDQAEERRLFYVAVTRASKTCTVSHTQGPKAEFSELSPYVQLLQNLLQS